MYGIVRCGIAADLTDIPGVDYRMATISGPPECCSRARKMVQDIVAEVHVLTFFYCEVTLAAKHSGGWLQSLGNYLSVNLSVYPSVCPSEEGSLVCSIPCV